MMGRLDLFGWWCAWCAALRTANGKCWWRGPLLWAVLGALGALALDAWGGAWAPLAVVALFAAGGLWLAVLARVAAAGPDTLFIFIAGAFALAMAADLIARLLYLSVG